MLQEFDEKNMYLGGIESEEDGEIVNTLKKIVDSSITINWQTNKYGWEKGTIGQEGYFKIKDPVSKMILTAMGDDRFELHSKYNSSVIEIKCLDQL